MRIRPLRFGYAHMSHGSEYGFKFGPEKDRWKVQIDMSTWRGEWDFSLRAYTPANIADAIIYQCRMPFYGVDIKLYDSAEIRWNSRKALDKFWGDYRIWLRERNENPKASL